MKANFLRHEGYLGAVGAFLSVNPMEQHLQPPPAVTEPQPADAANSGDDSGKAASEGREPRQVLEPSQFLKGSWWHTPSERRTVLATAL